ncbi:hypothetical protein PZH32_03840 [Adlercreutzia equolifaciens]|uniref:hypothetical protein n=1 Tax=Adlercreutzia equolifaciens TaxID=446660 RepID=UPI0023AF6A39|nr:hypothetical protein [Adlercreutzia equolifaciens]MDE8702090.1 hypothetical protein [Adlercreutzia equolifaciens]
MIELFANVIIPALAALLSFFGALFSKINQRSRIRSDIAIHNELSDLAENDADLSKTLERLKEQINRETSLLTGGEARWSLLPKGITFLLVGGLLFFALAKFIPNLNLSDFLSPFLVYLYFLILLLGAWCLTNGLKHIYRYIGLKAHLTQVLYAARSTLKDLEELNMSLNQAVTHQNELTSSFRYIAIALEEPSVKSHKPVMLYFPEIEKSVSVSLDGLKKLEKDLSSQDDAAKKFTLEKEYLQQKTEEVLKEISYIEKRSLFSLFLNSLSKKILNQQKKANSLEETLRENEDSISWCQEAVRDSVRLHRDINNDSNSENRIVIKDASTKLVFDTSKDIFDSEHLDNFFEDLRNGKFEVFKTKGNDEVLVVGKRNTESRYREHTTSTVIGFLISEDGRFPEYLRISHAPLRHTY